MPSLEPSRAHYIEALAAILAPIYGTTAQDVLSGSRLARNAYPRQIIAYTCDRQGWTSAFIGEYLGIDHSTVRHAAKRIRNRIASDAELRRTLTLLPDYQPPTSLAVSERWLAEREAYTRRLEGLVADLATTLRDELRIIHAIQELGAGTAASPKLAVVESEKLLA